MPKLAGSRSPGYIFIEDWTEKVALKVFKTEDLSQMEIMYEVLAQATETVEFVEDDQSPKAASQKVEKVETSMSCACSRNLNWPARGAHTIAQVVLF